MSTQAELAHGRRLIGRPATAAPAPVPARRWRRVVGVAVLVGAVLGAWWLALGQGVTALPGPMAVADRAAAFLADLAGAGADEPTAYEQASAWTRLAALTVDTMVMSVLASGLAGAGTLATVAFASRSLTVGEFASAPRPVGRAIYAVTRGAHVIARAVPEFVWALLLVFVLGPGLVTGALALALHELGVLGRLASDVVDDVDPGPLRALRSSGARTVPTFCYGALPQMVPQLVTFLLYRWEVVVRATVVVGFVAAAGLGYQLRLDFAQRDWPSVGLIVLAYVVLVLGAEAVAAGLRRLAR